jgi:hypothetical protein
MIETNYYQLFVNQLVTTFAQLTAMTMTGGIAVPLYNYYGPKVRSFKLFRNWGLLANQDSSDKIETEDEYGNECKGTFYLENDTTQLFQDFTDKTSFVFDAQVQVTNTNNSILRSLHEVKAVKLDDNNWDLVVKSIGDHTGLEFMILDNKLFTVSPHTLNWSSSTLKYFGTYFTKNLHNEYEDINSEGDSEGDSEEDSEGDSERDSEGDSEEDSEEPEDYENEIEIIDNKFNNQL